jgi:hypothetical protein
MLNPALIALILSRMTTPPPKLKMVVIMRAMRAGDIGALSFALSFYLFETARLLRIKGQMRAMRAGLSTKGANVVTE